MVSINGIDVTVNAVGETLDAMRRGTAVIIQAALSHQGWSGRVDILRRVEVRSSLGDWSYEAIDTKLARKTKAGTILQLCLYSELLGELQGLPPEYMHIVAPWTAFQPLQYRFADYAAYFRKVKRALAMTMTEQVPDDTYPDPIEHCDICRWREACDMRCHDDDHLSLVAGISKLQINDLKARGIGTIKGVADTNARSATGDDGSRSRRGAAV
jgi:predicted RecB family nuclease